MSSGSRLPFALSLGTLIFLLAYLVGVAWSYRLANPIGIIPAYTVGSLIGPFVSVRMAGREGFGATPLASFLPVLIGSGLAAAYFGLQERNGIASTPSPQVLYVFPMLLFPVGLAFAFLARWFARRSFATRPPEAPGA